MRRVKNIFSNALGRIRNKNLSIELSIMNRLHFLSTLVVNQGGMEEILDEIVRAAIDMTGADMGSIRLFEEETGLFKLVAQRGFPNSFIHGDHDIVYDPATCFRALEWNRRVVVNDTRSQDFEHTSLVRFWMEEGISTVQSTPLISRPGKMVGVLSTLHRSPYRYHKRELRFLDMLARQTADFVLHIRAKEELQENQEKYRILVEELQTLISGRTSFWVFFPMKFAIHLPL